MNVCSCVLSVCGKAKADIVFLVDESSSIGANNFIKMKDFIFRVATYFPVVGPLGTQVGLPVKTFLFDILVTMWLFDFKFSVRRTIINLTGS